MRTPGPSGSAGLNRYRCRHRCNCPRPFLTQETIPSAKTDYFPESCRFRTMVPQMRHWAGSSPHRKNMKEPALVLCGQHSFGEPKDGACVDENPRSGRYCRFARPRFAAETPVTTNAQAEPPRGFVHAPCPGQGTQSSVLSALFKKRSRKN